MATTPKELLDSCLEIEGLLALIIQRDNAVPQHLYDMINERTESLLSRLRELNPQASADIAEDAQNTTSPSPAIPPIPQDADVAPQIPDSDDEAIAESAIMEETEDADNSTDISDETIEDSNSDNDHVQDETQGKVDEQPSTINECDTDESEDCTSETAEEDDQESDTTPVEPAPAVEPVKQKVKFHFSVNDRFRFRRELFNFNDEEMDEALDIAAQMSTIEELEDYFFNDLCMDPSDETVQDFINIISDHLK